VKVEKIVDLQSSPVMDDVVGCVTEVVKTAIQIEEVANTVRHNKDECIKIARRVERIRAITACLEDTDVLSEASMINGLNDLEVTLLRALKLTKACQTKNRLWLLLTSRNIAKQLQEVNKEIMEKFYIVNFSFGIRLTVMLTKTAVREVDSHTSLSTGFTRKSNSVYDASEPEPMLMSLDLLREITDDFSKKRKLGSGAYGMVYEGVHQDGKKIAVKVLHNRPGLDEEEFQNEFKNLTRLRHQNIVRLVGYCHDVKQVQVEYKGQLVIAEETHRALCLEYISNGSLDKYLSDECDKYDWHIGYGIIKGICHGLKYLHDELKPPIYHLDLKPANVLLHENMVSRIADFGLSRLFGNEKTQATKSTLGTIGYIPPEFISHNLISSKFDIYSLGVVIIKIMAGRAGYISILDMSSQEFINLVQENWTKRLHETSNLRKAYSEQVRVCIEIGLSCVQDDRHKRPTIQDILDRLNDTETKCTYALINQDDPVREFANSKKITYDQDMHDINTIISRGRADFDVFVLQASSDMWEHATLVLTRTGYQINFTHNNEVVIEEKYSPSLQVHSSTHTIVRSAFVIAMTCIIYFFYIYFLCRQKFPMVKLLSLS